MVPVPLDQARQRERGYNQAELIAKPLARMLGIPFRSYLLLRTRPRPNQLRLTRRERWETVRGAYATHKTAQVDKLRVLLVDDVFTTGATLDACSRALKGAGAAQVVGLTVARALPHVADDGSRIACSGPWGMKLPGQLGRPPRPKLTPEVRGDARPAGALPPAVRKPAIMQEPVLVLNATFEPINVTAVRRAMVLMLKGVAQAEETNHTKVHSASRSLEVPSVIRLLAYRHIPQQTRALSRKNILLRDRNTCQFCKSILRPRS